MLDRSLSRALLLATLLLATLVPRPALGVPLSIGQVHTVQRARPRAFPVRGLASAPINILYWAPYGNSTTARIQPILQGLLHRHPHLVRIQWMPRYRRGSPYGAERYAALAGLVAFFKGGDALFWAYNDALCGLPNLHRLNRKTVERVALRVGLSAARLRSAERQDRLVRLLAESQDLLARLGVRSYFSGPVLLVGTRLTYLGAYTRPGYLDALVRSEQRRIAPWLRQGLAGAALHDRMLAESLRRYHPHSTRPRPGAKRLLSPLHHSIPAGSSPRQGPATARLTLVAFLDFTDYLSYRLWQLLERARGRYAGRIRIVLKAFPRMRYSPSLLAAKALFAAHAQGKAWDMAAVLFRNRYSIRPFRITSMARQAGLDPALFRRALLRTRVRRHVLRDVNLGRRIGLTRAPALFVNGRRLMRPYANRGAFWRLLARKVRGGLLSRALSP